VKNLAGVPASGPGWQERLLELLSRLYLLLEGFKHLETLPQAVQADIRTLIGWAQNQQELLAEPGIHDHWLVLGQRVEEEDRLRVQRTWLWGEKSTRTALLLHFAPSGQPLDTSLLPGTRVDAELVFFPGFWPLRALIKGRQAVPTPLDTLPGYATIAAARGAYADALGHNPWLEQFPMALQAVIPIMDQDRWAVADAAGHILPLAPRFEQGWTLMALSGGHPLVLFGEWDGDYLLPLSAWADEQFHSFSSLISQNSQGH
jgi:hypothetical protein